MLAFVALLFVCLLSLAVGSRPIGLGTSIDALTHYDASDPDHVIVHDVRVSRTLIGLMVGTALGLAGALMQGVTRNPLADPGLLGVTAGAATAIAVAVLVIGVGPLAGYVWFAFAGAALGAPHPVFDDVQRLGAEPAPRRPPPAAAAAPGIEAHRRPHALVKPRLERHVGQQRHES